MRTSQGPGAEAEGPSLPRETEGGRERGGEGGAGGRGPQASTGAEGQGLHTGGDSAKAWVGRSRCLGPGVSKCVLQTRLVAMINWSLCDSKKKFFFLLGPLYLGVGWREGQWPLELLGCGWGPTCARVPQKGSPGCPGGRTESLATFSSSMWGDW